MRPKKISDSVRTRLTRLRTIFIAGWGKMGYKGIGTIFCSGLGENGLRGDWGLFIAVWGMGWKKGKIFLLIFIATTKLQQFTFRGEATLYSEIGGRGVLFTEALLEGF